MDMIDQLPKTNSLYSLKQYWDDRYQNEECYEWFAGYKPYQNILQRNIKSADKILTLGCGNSRLSEDMYHDGFQFITNTDYSEVVIENMRNKTKDLVDMTWEVKDIYHLDYQNESYDVILEKGTIDALLVDERDPWQLSQKSLDGMHRILQSVSRILRPGGRFISITFAQPHFRIPVYALDEFDWDVKCDKFGETFHFFIYTMTKGLKLSNNVRQISQRYCDSQKKDDKPIIFCDPQKEDFVSDISYDLFS